MDHPEKPDAEPPTADESALRPDGRPPRDVQVFVSSPGDVTPERLELDKVIEGLNKTYSGIARFAPYHWYESSYTVKAGYQRQIPDTANYDIVIAIFGDKLGAPFPPDFQPRKKDGTLYLTGTAYEVETALEAFVAEGRPTVYAFRKTADVQVIARDRASREQATRDLDQLQEFLEGPLRGGVVRPFGDIKDFNTKVARALVDWIDKNILGTRKPLWDIITRGSPFRGLQPFDARHAQVFFGRDRKVDLAIKKLSHVLTDAEGRPFLLVVGVSGSGKSSLVRAGVVPRLTAPKGFSGGENDNGADMWRVAVMQPGAAATPQMALARSLQESGEEDKGGFGQALPELAGFGYSAAEDLAKVLRDLHDVAEKNIVAALEAAGRKAAEGRRFAQPLRANLLLVVDQFEELFADSVTPQDRAAFADLLTVLTKTRRIWVVATLRVDMFAQVVSDSAVHALTSRGAQYELRPPGAEELAEILRRSGTDTGLEYEQNKETGEFLDERLLSDAAGENTLPLLEFALEQLFQQRVAIHRAGRRDTWLLTYAAYDKLGGIDGVIDTVAEAALVDPDYKLDREALEPDLKRLLRSLVERVYPQSETAAISQVTLNICTAPLPAEKLNDPLIRALQRRRILVTTKAGENGGATMRLAHERVLTSWKRAREIIRQDEHYFRVQKDIATRLLGWVERARASEGLLPHGTLLTDAQAMLRDSGADISPDMRGYIQASVRRDRWKQGSMLAGMVGAIVLAVGATLFGLTAWFAEGVAARNFAAAKGAANTLVTSVGTQMRDLENVNAKTLTTVFDVVNRLVTTIEGAASEQRSALAAPLRPLVAELDSLMGGGGGRPGDLDALDALAKWETAETFHNFGMDSQAVRQAAEYSLDLRRQLSKSDHSEELQWQLALSYRLLGDLYRAASRQDPTKLADARVAYETALPMTRGLFDREPNHLEYGRGVTMLLARLGDLDLFQHPDQARAYYEAERDLSQLVFGADKDNPDSQKELAWAFNKMGSYWMAQHRYPQAQAEFVQEVCVRRHIAVADRSQTRSQQDLGWSLSRVAHAELAISASAEAARNALFEALEVRGRLASLDVGNPTWQKEYAATLQDIAAYYGTLGNRRVALDFAMAALRSTQLATMGKSYDGAQRDLAAAEERVRAAQKEDGDDATSATIERADEDISSEQLKVRVQRQGAATSEAEKCWNEIVASIGHSAPATVTQ
jgi:hypothetical protein